MGTWTGSPTSYVYQWQDCNASGDDCVNASGPTTSAYALGVNDVGHTVRVVVTASNAGGATPASSASVGPVTALPPTASFTATPTAPVVGQPVTLDATNSSCTDGPCTYAWSDDGSTTRPIPALWPLGSGQMLSFTFSTAGTKYIRLVVTNAAGQTATVEHNLTVEVPSPPPTPPSSTAPPFVNGTAKVGQTLTANNGSWSGSTPMSYAYQWQDCNDSGESCSNITEASSSTYTLVEADVGHTVQVIVTATNSAGSTHEASMITSIVSGKSGDVREKECFSSPHDCGYPDATNTGVESGMSLTPTGSITASSEGQTISAKQVTGTVEVTANNVTIENTKIELTGAGCEQTLCGNALIRQASGVTGLKLKHVETKAAPGTTCQNDVANNYGGTVEIEDSYIHACDDPIHSTGTLVLTGSYVVARFEISLSHVEDVYFENTVTAKDDTVFNPIGQTADFFGNTNNGVGDEPCDNHLTIEGSLLAGGGYSIYPCAHSGSLGSSSWNMKNDHFARCLTKEIYEPDGGEHLCEDGPDSFGFYPKSGDYGLFSSYYKPTEWSNVVWDNNLEAIAEP